MRTIVDNLGSIVLSLVLAVMIWVVALNEGRGPLRDGRFPPNGLPIEVINQREGLVVEDISDKATVDIRAPQVTWDELRPSNFRAFVDLSGLGAGLRDVPVQVRCAECSQKLVNILSVEPAHLTVRIDEFRQRSMPVQVHILDAPLPGYTTGQPTTDPITVTVSGPASQVEKVDEVSAQVFLAGARTPIDLDYRLAARDRDGSPIPQVTLSPSSVHVHIPISQRVGYKDVSVKVVTRGTVAPGYWLSNIVVQPPTLTISGNPGVLDAMPGYVETEPIDLAGAQSSIARQVSLLLPEGVSVADPAARTVLVRIEVSADIGGRTIERVPSVRGLVPGLLVTSISPDKLDVIVSGQRPVLQSLKPEDIQVWVDASTLVTGTYKLKPSASIASPAVKIESVVPDTVQVTIGGPAAATPSSP